MKRLIPLTLAAALVGTTSFAGGLSDAAEERIVEVVPTTAVGETTMIGGLTYVAIALGVLVLVAAASEDSGSDTNPQS